MADILIIDDEPGVLGVLRKILEGAGHSVSEAPDGESALRAFEGAPADLVITDIFMPDIDGLKILKVIKVQYPDLPVLVITGFGSEFPNNRLSDNLGRDYAEDEVSNSQQNRWHENRLITR